MNHCDQIVTKPVELDRSETLAPVHSGQMLVGENRIEVGARRTMNNVHAFEHREKCVRLAATLCLKFGKRGAKRLRHRRCRRARTNMFKKQLWASPAPAFITAPGCDAVAFGI